MKKKILIKRVLIAIFIVSLIPILAMSFYAKPLWDDFNSIYVAKVIADKYSPILTIFAPLINSLINYFSWQGTYSAEFLFALQPGGWWIPAYWLTTFLMIGTISFGYIYFFRVIVTNIFLADKSFGTIFSLLLLTVQFQYVPYIHQAFYWFNGSVYYSFFYGLSLIELGIIIKLLFEDVVTKKKIIWTSILIFMVSGGNYSTALVNVMILFMLMIFTMVKHKDKFIMIRNMTIVAAGGLFISMIAPGNSVRASSSVSMNPIKAIIMSFINALKLIKEWVDLPQLGLLICLIPLALLIVKNTDFKFKYPIVALGVMFGLFSAQLTPPLYAMSIIGDTRQINMYYYSMYLLMAGCLIYICGWLNVKYSKLTNSIEGASKWIIIVALVVIIIGVAHGDVHSTSFYKAASDIVSGRASKYDKEYDEIINSIKNSDAVCYVNDIAQETNCFDKMWIDKDPEYWVNQSLASYFDKDKIILKEKY